MNRIMQISVIVGALTVFAFNLLSLNVLWLNVGEEGNIGNISVIIASNFIFKAFSALIIGFIVDRIPKKKAIVASLFLCAVFAVAWLFAHRFLVIAVIVYIAIDFVSDIYADSFMALVAEKLSARNYIKLDAIELITSRAVTIASGLISAALLILLNQEIVSLIIVLIFIISAIICHKLLPAGKVTSEVTMDEDGTEHENTSKHGASNILDSIESSWDFFSSNVLADKRIMLYTVILFILNLDYAFIPTVLPFFIMSLQESTSLILVVIMRFGNDIGEFIASAILVKYGHLVSLLTKTGLIGSALVFSALPIVYTFPIAAALLFVLYGVFDTLSQPYYSHFVSSLDNDKRGRILGIVSFMVLLASPLGILLGNWLSSFGMLTLSTGIVFVFVFCTIVISASKSFGNIRLDPNAVKDDGDEE